MVAPPTSQVRMISPAGMRRALSPEVMMERSMTPQERPRNLRNARSASERSPMWPERWSKEQKDRTRAEGVVDKMLKDFDSAMMEMLEQEAEREAEREIMLRGVGDPEKRLALEKRFTEDRAASTRQVMEMAARQDRLMRERSNELGLGDASPRAASTGAVVQPRSANFIKIDSRPSPAPVKKSAVEEGALLMSAARSGSRGLPVMGYYPSKLLKSPFASPSANPRRKIEPYGSRLSPLSTRHVSPENSDTQDGWLMATSPLHQQHDHDSPSRSPEHRGSTNILNLRSPERSSTPKFFDSSSSFDSSVSLRGGSSESVVEYSHKLDSRGRDPSYDSSHGSPAVTPQGKGEGRQRSISLYQGMMHMLSELAPPWTPMARSPRADHQNIRSVGTRSSSAMAGSIVFSPSHSPSEFPRCETPTDLRSKHWASATRDVVKLGEKVRLDQREMSVSLVHEDAYAVSMAAAKQFLLQNVVEFPTGAPHGHLGVERPVTAALLDGLKDKADELASLNPKTPTTGVSLRATYGRAVRDRKRSEKTKMLQLRIEQVRSEVADKMDKVIFGGLLAEEEKEQNKVELAATVCLFAELDATSPTALFPGILELLVAVLGQASTPSAQASAAVALSRICVQSSVRRELLHRVDALPLNLGGEAKEEGHGCLAQALTAGMADGQPMVVIQQCALLAHKLCMDGGLEACRRNGLLDALKELLARKDVDIKLGLLELPEDLQNEFLVLETEHGGNVGNVGNDLRPGTSLSKKRRSSGGISVAVSAGSFKAGGGSVSGAGTPKTTNVGASRRSSHAGGKGGTPSSYSNLDQWSPTRTMARLGKQVMEVQLERRVWRPKEENLPLWERHTGLAPPDLHVSAKTLPARHKE